MGRSRGYNLVQKHKTYAQYLADSKPITHDIAPVNATPKLTKGDSHKHRQKLQTMKETHAVFLNDIPVRKDGTVIVKHYKKLRGDNG